jgi:DNA-binding CsgD family transcriptional regulator
MKELDVYSYASWVEGQMAWLYLLEGRFTHARLQIEAIRGQSNPSQAMHVQVLVAILQMLDGEWESAEGLLNEALTFYERADEPLICCALHFYLAYNALHQYMPTLFLSHANQAFSWMTQHEIATVPHWWHPKIMAEICTHALMSDLHAPLIEQILVHHLGQAAMPALKLLENTEDIDLRRKANRLHQIIAGRNTDSLSHLGNTPSKSVLYELLNSGNLRLETYPLLEQELTTASRRQRPNATILAVFGLYINGYTRDEIAKRLECSVENVRNYITVIYHHFDLPDHQYKGRELRRQKLIELARERGYIH